MRTGLDRWLPRAAAGTLVATVVAVVLVITLSGHDQPSAAGSLSRGQAFSATWSLFPTSHLFGDTVHMRVEATVDRRRLDPRLLRLEAPLKPYERIGPRRRTQRDIGRYTHVVYGIDLRCVSSDCVASIGAIRRLHLEPARLVYRGRPPPGGVKPITYTWPVILAFSRLERGGSHLSVRTRTGSASNRCRPGTSMRASLRSRTRCGRTTPSGSRLRAPCSSSALQAFCCGPICRRRRSCGVTAASRDLSSARWQRSRAPGRPGGRSASGRRWSCSERSSCEAATCSSPRVRGRSPGRAPLHLSRHSRRRSRWTFAS